MDKPLITFYSIFRSFPELVHGFATRQGGVSPPPYHWLNLGLNTPDATENVRRNRQLFFQALHISPERVVFPGQVHSDTIHIVSAPGTVPNCDALITDRTELYLSIQTADCFPVFLYEPQRRIVAIIHSGWRGTAKNITGKTIRKLKTRFMIKPEHLFAVIGPGVQKTCYQVDQTVVKYFSPQFFTPDGKGRFLLDLQGSIRQQMLDEGVLAAHIELDPTCTHCRSDLYFSYRRDGHQSGRMMGIIGLRG